MKRLMTIALVLSAVLAASAQGKWTTYELQADELTGEPGGKYMKFVNDTLGSVTVREGDDFWMRVESYDGNFYGIYSSTENVGIVRILCGLYDDNGKLVEKYDSKIRGTEHHNFRSVWLDSSWAYFGQKAVMKKIIAGIKSGGGSARIVIHRVDKPDFDLRVTPFQQ